MSHSELVKQIAGVLGCDQRNVIISPEERRVSISVGDAVTVSFAALMDLSKLLGTTAIDVTQGHDESGWSEYTPGWHENGDITCRDVVLPADPV